MRKSVLAAAALVILSSVPVLASDYRHNRHGGEIRRDLAEIRRLEAELRRDLWSYRHGARNWREVQEDRRRLRRARLELRRDLARRGR